MCHTRVMKGWPVRRRQCLLTIETGMSTVSTVTERLHYYMLSLLNSWIRQSLVNYLLPEGFILYFYSWIMDSHGEASAIEAVMIVALWAALHECQWEGMSHERQQGFVMSGRRQKLMDSGSVYDPHAQRKREKSCAILPCSMWRVYTKTHRSSEICKNFPKPSFTRTYSVVSLKHYSTLKPLKCTTVISLWLDKLDACTGNSPSMSYVLKTNLILPPDILHFFS